MKYMMLMWFDEGRAANLTPEQWAVTNQAFQSFTEELKSAGKYVANEGLKGTDVATSVQVRDGQRLVTDGPFAETKKQILGLFLIETEDLDAAVEWAAKSPAARHGSVEVRAIYDARPMMEEAANG